MRAGATAVAACLLFAIAASSAHALASRVWISGHGADVAGCGPPNNPCRTLQYAHDSVVAAGGEIDVLDPAGYGTINITKAVSIVNDGVGTAGVIATSGTAISIAAGPGDAVHLRGLTIEGLGTATNAIKFSSGKRLDVINCVVRHFTGDVISIVPTTSSSVALVNTLVADNAGGTNVAISFTPFTASGGKVSGTLQNVTVSNSGLYGVAAQSGFMTGGALDVTIIGGIIAGNGYGVVANTLSASSGSSAVTLRDSLVFNNNIALATNAGGTNLGVSIRTAHSLIFGNTTLASIVSGGTIYSYHDNDIDGNTTNNTGLLTAATEQ